MLTVLSKITVTKNIITEMGRDCLDIFNHCLCKYNILNKYMCLRER